MFVAQYLLIFNSRFFGKKDEKNAERVLQV